MMKNECIITGPFDVNCYLAIYTGDRMAVVDPGADAAAIADRIRRSGATVTHYLITHGHVDHIGALAELTAAFPAPVLLHPLDASWAFSVSNCLEPYYPTPAKPESPIIFPDDFTLEMNDCRVRIIHTPGHSPGSVCYYFPEQGTLFSGDTLFKSSVGRTDLPGGDERQLAEALSRLRELPPDTRVYPGHGPATTIGEECRSNPFMGEYDQ